MRARSIARRLLSSVCLALLMTIGASAQSLYNDGPINGDTDAWVINFGFVVSNTFTLTQSSQVGGLSFGAWLFPGDVLDSVEVSITAQEGGGTTFFDQQVNTTTGACFANSYGFNVCEETASFSGPNLAGGTYWVNLQNAMVDSGDPTFWDENSGVGCTSPGCPSEASYTGVGTIPSESFTILGTSSGTGSVPEPASLTLLAGGAIAIGRILRKR
jgi:hypothetical protein